MPPPRQRVPRRGLRCRAANAIVMRRPAGHAKIRKHQGTPMAREIAGIDHAIVGVRDLEQARASYQRLGFRVTPRGRHVGWGTANYCVMFERDYLELLGIVDDSQFTNN